MSPAHVVLAKNTNIVMDKLNNINHLRRCMKYTQSILFILSLLPMTLHAATGIDSNEAAHSFRNSLSPQHKMQSLLGSPKFDAIGKESDDEVVDDEPPPRPQPKRAPTPPPAAKVELGEMQSFTGKLVKAEWQKSTESYCQGGSTYYALIVENKRYVVNSLRDPIFENNSADFDKLQAQFAPLEGKTVTLQGQTISRHFSQQEQCPNPMMQCIATEITCDWLRVTEIKQ